MIHSAWWGRHEFTHMGGFSIQGTPKWLFYIRENPFKMNDLGVPPFQETSICVCIYIYIHTVVKIRSLWISTMCKGNTHIPDHPCLATWMICLDWSGPRSQKQESSCCCPKWWTTHYKTKNQWIGLENLQEKPILNNSMGKLMVSCRFSFKPIHWNDECSELGTTGGFLLCQSRLQPGRTVMHQRLEIQVVSCHQG